MAYEMGRFRSRYNAFRGGNSTLDNNKPATNDTATSIVVTAVSTPLSTSFCISNDRLL